MRLSQSSAVAAALIVAFIVFVTVRGELPCYLEVMGIASTGCKVPGVTGTAPGFNLFGSSSAPGVSVGVGGGGVNIGVNAPGTIGIGGSGPTGIGGGPGGNPVGNYPRVL